MLFGQAILPYIFPSNLTTTVWEEGVVAQTQDGPHLANLSYSWLINYFTANEFGTLDVSSMLGLPSYLPYNMSRTLKFFSAADWSGFTINVLYKNAYGYYILNSLQGPNNTTVEFGLPFAGMDPLLSNNFFYMNRIESVTLTQTGALPAVQDDIVIDYGVQGMTRLTVMNSGSHYWGSSIQVLGSPVGTDPSYNIYMDNYPMMVTDNQPVYSAPLSSLDFANTAATPLTIASDIPDAANWISQLSEAPFLINSTSPEDESAIFEIPYAVSTVRVEIYTENEAKLLITLLQNASAF